MAKKAKVKPLTLNQEKFADWLACPKSQRVPMTQEDLADVLGVKGPTLSRWKHLPALWQRVKALADVWAHRQYPDIMASLAHKARSGDTQAIRLYLEYVHKWARAEQVQIKHLPPDVKEVLYPDDEV